MSRGRRPPTSLIQYHCLGEIQTPTNLPRFHTHSSTPGGAALLHQRNPHHTQDFPLKVFPRHSVSPQHQAHAERKDCVQGESPLNCTISTLEAMKLAQGRVYAESSMDKVSSCGLAASVTQEQYLQQKAATRAGNTTVAGDPVNNSWLYVTKSEAAFHRKRSEHRIDPFVPSADGPEWFQLHEKPSIKHADLTKGPGFDGTLTVLSRINGWITVTPKEKNRSRRLGRYGPFDKSKRETDLMNVSDLAPHWMHTGAVKPTNSQKFRKIPGILALRGGHKQTFLVDAQQPAKSQFAIGDYRHNVMTKEDANRYMSSAEPHPKNLLQWPEDVPRQRFDKPVAKKIG